MKKKKFNKALMKEGPEIETNITKNLVEYMSRRLNEVLQLK